MGKIEKKKAKLQERINTLETELRESLTKKSSATAEIDVAGITRKIQQTKDQLAKL